ncbi:MAG: hypothetical protein HYV07_00465 [Deltaproteobacteria bacterium]|nr:hypothetical protein [Deltaproteobacteria bacterium]
MRRALLSLTLVILACSDPPAALQEPDAAVDASTSDAAPLDATLGDARAFDDAAVAPDAGIASTPDPRRVDNDQRDSDCDGLTDEEEFSTRWPSGAATDPGDPDTDGDGLPDGLEVGRTSSPACVPAVDADPATHTDPTESDTDGDGLPDGAEDADHDGRVASGVETDPRNPDTDGDGLCDGPADVVGRCTGGDPSPLPTRPMGPDADSDGLIDSLDPNPAVPDTDGDGLCDGPNPVAGACAAGEDLDGDGTLDPGESDPRSVDSDCDGLNDFEEVTLGTDPSDLDTDDDGLPDGLESGVTSADAACTAFVPDADPTTTTDPARADTDRDEVSDGSEDANQDGRVDPEELDPNDPTDASDPTIQLACTSGRLTPVVRHVQLMADQQIVTADRRPSAFLETSTLLVGGRIVGQMGFNAELGVAFAAITRTPSGVDATEEELADRALVESFGAITTPLTRTFQTWDGYGAVSASYDVAGTGGVKSAANRLAELFAPGVTGTLATAQDVSGTGGFAVAAEYVIRSPTTAVVLLALAPASALTDEVRFALSDLADGLSLGQARDALVPRCRHFASQTYASLDILWAVDNSASMRDEQLAVAQAAQGMVAKLENAAVDWRAGLVTSGFYNPNVGNGCSNLACGETYRNQCRSFTRDLTNFSAWLTEGAASWVGAGGSCNVAREEVVESARMILSDPASGSLSFLPSSATSDPNQLRSEADFLLIFLGDADDQAYGNAAAAAGIDAYELFFRALPVRSLTMGGIICPEGSTCGEAQRTPRVIRGVLNRFGAVIGSLRDLVSIPPTVGAIVDAGIGASGRYEIGRDAIPSTIKIAMEVGSTVGTCDVTNVPRSRQDGFDYDARTGRIAFYGDCRPDPARPGRSISISYRAFADQSASPDPVACDSCGSCSGLARCDLDICACSCDAAMTCGPGLRFDPDACDCVCDAEALGCAASRIPDAALCACVCRPDCGGCAANEECQASFCECRPRDF